MIQEVAHSFAQMFTPTILGLLVLATCLGLLWGTIPGLGGVSGMAMLFPFVMTLEPAQALVLMMGLTAVSSTSDTIPAVLLGVPGSGGSQATIVDGYPMAKKGEGARALGAAYSASVIGGLIGAAVLLAALPLARPIIFSFGSPELLMTVLFGVTLISTLTSSVPYIGLALGIVGILTSQIGIDFQTGRSNWTFGVQYLIEGLPIIPAILGLFAIPELIDLVGRKKRSIARPEEMQDIGSGMLQGIKDTLHHWSIVIRGSIVGVIVGIIPGLGGSVVDWIAYAHVKQTSRKDQHLYGTGDVRGVIGPESANNSKEGGSLIPTVVFGIPGGGSMIILLGVFAVHGIRPGPDMLTTQFSLTMTLVWTIAFTNIIAVIIMLGATRQIAKICLVPASILVPVVSVLIVFAALQATRYHGDIVMVLAFGLLGWFLKRAGWPRPPIMLGMVLGPMLNQYLFISVQRYGAEFLTFRSVHLIGLLIVASIVFTGYQSAKERRRRLDQLDQNGGDAVLVQKKALIGSLVFAALFIVILLDSLTWQTRSVQVFIQITAGTGLVVSLVQLVSDLRLKASERLVRASSAPETSGTTASGANDGGVDDAMSGTAEPPTRAVDVLSKDGSAAAASRVEDETVVLVEDEPVVSLELGFIAWLFLLGLIVWLVGISLGGAVFLLVCLSITVSIRAGVIASGALFFIMWGILEQFVGMGLYDGIYPLLP